MAMSMFARTGLALAALIVGLDTASAAEATRLGTFKYWTAWTSSDANGKICYISSNPQDKQPADLDHGDIYLFVLHREKAPDYSNGKDGSTFAPIRGEVQAQMGYTVKPRRQSQRHHRRQDLSHGRREQIDVADLTQRRAGFRQGHEGRHHPCGQVDLRTRQQYQLHVLAQRRDRRHGRDRQGLSVGPEPRGGALIFAPARGKHRAQ